MSFPPRPPYGMPMMSGGFSFTPMGMNMMPMQMMRPVMRPMAMAPVVPQQQQQQQSKQIKKLVPQDIPKSNEEKPPVTTVFVGSISERAPDMMCKQMLQRCGNVLSWKRVQGASGKLQAFGFCEFEYPEATLRCIRLLNEWQIADKKLKVKVDAKTKTLLDEYLKKKKAKEPGKEEGDKGKDKDKDKDKESDSKENGEKGDKADKEEGEESASEEVEELDENTLREDRVARAGLEAIMREYAFELAKEPPTPKPVVEKDVKPSVQKKDMKEPRDVGFEDMDLEDDKKEMINKEIRMFRDMHKGNEEDEENKERDRKERERYEELKRRRDKEKERNRERLREREREKREREREREREIERERTRSRSRSSSRGRSRRRRSPSRDNSRDRSRDRRKEREQEEEEEAYERRKLEKKLREKEAAYQERLKNWEKRERNKTREYEKEKEREDEKKAEESREGRRLKEFLEDYDDLRDDPKFYKGSPLARRLKEREKEKEADLRDRQREKEEIEELKRKLLDQGHPDPEAELARLEREQEEHLRPRLQLAEPERAPSEVSDQPEKPKEESSSSSSEEEEEEEEEEKPPLPPKLPPGPPPKPVVETAPSLQSVSETNTPFTDEEASRHSMPGQFMDESSQSQPSFGPASKEQSMKMGFGSLKLGASSSPVSEPTPTPTIVGPSLPPVPPPTLSGGTTVVMGPAAPKRKKLTVGDVFNQDDDDQLEGKKRKLIPLDYDEDKTSLLEEKKPTTLEEKRQRIKALIENIPTHKDELFNYPLDWSVVDQILMDKRIKPWVTKKIVEYIGEEEPTLTDFICQKVVAHSTPQSIQNDVAMVLDEEAEVFVVKMWRLLVYETEAKKQGLVK